MFEVLGATFKIFWFEVGALLRACSSSVHDSFNITPLIITHIQDMGKKIVNNIRIAMAKMNERLLNNVSEIKSVITNPSDQAP